MICSIFGTLFLLSGILIGYRLLYLPASEIAASAKWVEVPADIQMLKFNTHRYKKVVNSEQRKSTDYSVDGMYIYTYEGVTYSSSKLSFYSGRDNVGDYWRELYDRLERDRKNENTKAWVNPENPNEAVLDRASRWGMWVFAGAFFVLFVICGCLFFWGASRPLSKS